MSGIDSIMNFFTEEEDKVFLGKALYLLLVFFESMTDFVFILLELVSNW